MSTQLATGSASAHLSNMAGRAILSARGHYFIVDSPPTLSGPNEEINPIDVLMSALASCGAFICEVVAREHSIPLHSVKVTAAGDFDPRGICGEPVASNIQAFRVKLSLSGPNQEQADRIAAGFTQRCPIYTTLKQAAPIEIEIDLAPTAQGSKE